MDYPLNQINAGHKGTLAEALGIEITLARPGHMEATMPVDQRTIQPMGLLHGGASVALAETLGSLGSFLLVKHENKAPVGLEINANHIKSAKKGLVKGVATAIHQGRRTHIWHIEIKDEEQNLICISRLTVMISDL
jgi:1,4-dihydroxy-2-naphthoyl-CoA hydrolase